MNREKALDIFNKLKEISDNFHMAGSLRRGKKDNIGDLDVVHFGLNLPEIPNDYVMEAGDEIVRLKIDGEQIDIYRTDEAHFGAMLLFLTGSKDFNINLRALAKGRGWKLNQLGLFDEKDNLIAARTEKEIFDAMQLPWYEPEERVINRGSDKNPQLVNAIKQLGRYSDLEGESFKARAYINAADVISSIENIELLTYEELIKIDGVGKSIAEKVVEFIKTGSLKKLEQLKAEFPVEDDLFTIEGVGPKTVVKLFKELGVKNLNQLKQVCENNSILTVSGLGVKLRDKILKQLK